MCDGVVVGADRMHPLLLRPGPGSAGPWFGSGRWVCFTRELTVLLADGRGVLCGAADCRRDHGVHAHPSEPTFGADAVRHEDTAWVSALGNDR
jgi:hypothetical protein